jgi:hypothetical protein
MALPAIKRTGNGRTLTFSGDLKLQAKSRTANIAIFGAGGVPNAWCGTPGKDRKPYEINYNGSLDPFADACDKTSIGGGDCHTNVTVFNTMFRITGSLVQDWELARAYGSHIPINRSKYSLRLKVEIMNSGGTALATVFDTTLIEYDSYISVRDIDGSFSITMPVEQVLRWRLFPNTGLPNPIPNPFDPEQHPSRRLTFEERFTGPLTWSVTLGALSSSGSRTFTPLDGDDPTISAILVPDYGLTLSASASGRLIPGIPIEASILNVVSANWNWSGYNGPGKTGPGSGSWAGAGGDYSQTAIVNSDVAVWERISAGDTLWVRSSETSGSGLKVRFLGEGNYSTGNLDPSPPPTSDWFFIPGVPTLSSGPLPIGTIRMSPPNHHEIQGVCKDFDDPYTQAVRFRSSVDLLVPSAYMTNVGGTFGKQFDFQEIAVDLQPPPDSFKLQRYNVQQLYYYCELDGNHAFTTFLEDGNDNRASFHTRAIDCLTASVLNQITYDDFGSTTGWVGASANLSSSGTTLTIEALANGASAIRTYSPKLNTESKRFLRVRIMCNRDPKLLQIVVNGGKTWQITTGTKDAWADIEIDTMLPNAIQGTGPDQKDVRWPCDTLVNDEPTIEGKHQGLNRIGTLKIQGLDAGDIVYLDSMIGHTSQWERLQYLNSDRSLDFSSGYPSLSVKRCALGLVDGRQGLEMFGTRKSGSTLSHLTCQEFIDGANKFNGWTWTRGSFDILASWNTNNITAPEVMGGGWMWDGMQWINSIRLDMSSTQVLKGTLLVDLIEHHPGAGSVHEVSSDGYGDYTHRITARCHHIFRGRAHGIVWDGNYRPVSGASLSLVEPFNANFASGAGSSDVVGYFETKPGGRPYQYKRLFNGPTALGDIQTFHSRRLHRLGGLVALLSKNAWRLSTEDGDFDHMARIEGAGLLAYYRANHSTKFYGWDVNTVVSQGPADHPRMCQDHRRVLHLVYELQVGTDGSGRPIWNAYERESWDDGETWTDEILMGIPNGRRPTIAFGHHDGVLIRAAFVYNDVAANTGPGKIRSTYQELGDVAQSAVTTFKDQAGVDIQFEDDQFHLTQAYDNGARWILSVRVNSELETSEWYSTDNCQTWRRI